MRYIWILSIAGLLITCQAEAREPSTYCTNRSLDIAIQGNGYIAAKLPASAGGALVYTRFGNLRVDRDGELVLSEDRCVKLEPRIALPPGATDLNIDSDGTVTARLASAEPQTIGQIYLTTFEHPEALRPAAHTTRCFVATDTVGKVENTIPGKHDAGRLVEGHLDEQAAEMGRVEPLKFVRTDRPLDVSVNGDGFFKLKLPDGWGAEVGYTRCGHFSVDPVGQLIADEIGGAVALPEIRFPKDTTDIDISPDGEVRINRKSKDDQQVVGRIRLTRFVNPAALAPSPRDSRVRIATDTAGQALEADAHESGTGSMLQGYLENASAAVVASSTTPGDGQSARSNVNPVP